MKSTSGHVFMLSSEAISWSSKKQQVVSLSTTEAEFIAPAPCACLAVWLRRILEELQYCQQGPTQIFCDNSCGGLCSPGSCKWAGLPEKGNH